MKTLFIALAIFFTSTIVYGNDFDFRKTNWGNSREQVRAVENEENVIVNEDQYLGYQLTLLDWDFAVMYEFEGKKLVISMYLPMIFSECSFKYHLPFYNKFKTILIKKYNTPLVDSIKNPEIINEAKVYTNLSGLKHIMEWETKTTRIILTYDEDEGTNLSYINKNFYNKTWKSKNTKTYNENNTVVIPIDQF